MALIPNTPNPAEQTAVTGDRIGQGFYTAEQLLGGTSLVIAGGATYQSPALLMPGFNSLRAHIDITHPGGGAVRVDVQTFDPVTEVIEPALVGDFLLFNAFAGGTLANQLAPLLGGIVYPFWLNRIQIVNNPVLPTTINDIKLWLTRE